MRMLKSPITWITYLVCMLPAAYYFQQASSNNLGFDPIGSLESALRFGAIGWFSVGLLLGPITRFTRFNLMGVRTPLRLVAYSYLILLIVVYLLLDRQLDMEIIWIDLEGIQYRNVFLTLWTCHGLVPCP